MVKVGGGGVFDLVPCRPDGIIRSMPIRATQDDTDTSVSGDVVSADTVVEETVSMNSDFGFSDPVVINIDSDMPDDNDDIPPVPFFPRSSSTGSTDDKGAPRGAKSANRRSHPKHKERQAEYQRRIAMAKETAPLAAAAINFYVNKRLGDKVAFDSNSDKNLVPYWWLDTNKGEQVISGTIAEAACFHGLAGASGVTGKLVELLESYPTITGLIYIAGMTVYLELIIHTMLEQLAAHEKAAANPVG